MSTFRHLSKNCYLALGACAAFAGCQLSPRAEKELPKLSVAQQAVRNQPMNQWGSIYDRLLREGTISREERDRLTRNWQEANARLETELTREANAVKAQQAAAEQRARDWAALTPQQRMEWEFRWRQQRARGFAELQRQNEADRRQNAQEYNEWYANWRREQQAADTNRALNDIADGLRRP